MSLIKVDKRNKRTNAKQLRRNGLVPCCVYGGNLPGSISIQMSQHAANQLMHPKREGSKVTLELDGRLISTQIKEKKGNLLRHEIEHFSFQALAADQRINSIAHILCRR